MGLPQKEELKYYNLPKTSLFITVFIFSACITIHQYVPENLSLTYLRIIIPISLAWGYAANIAQEYKLSNLFFSYLSFCLIYFGTEIITFELYLPHLSLNAQAYAELIFGLYFFYIFLCATILLLAWNKNKTFSFIFLSILQIVFLLPFVAKLIYWCTAKTPVTMDTILAIYQTNFFEAYEYILTYVDFFYIIIASLACTTIFFLNSKLNFKLTIPRKTKIIFLCLILAAGWFLIQHKDYSRFADLNAKSYAYVSEIKKYHEIRANKRLNVKNIPVNNTAKISDSTFILVIGESQNKSHMSAYGYHKNTTPWLDSMKNAPDFILFDNVYSNHTHTVPTLHYALTEISQYHNTEKTFAEVYSIIDLAKAAGYQVTWLSNQPKYGAYDTPVSVIAEEADRKIWLKNYSNSNAYDEKLIDYLPENNGGKQLIIVHLIGSHFAYKQRYPTSFNRFNEEKDFENDVNYYDNSILYNDYVMSLLFAKAKKQYNLSGFIYFSDHAEDVTGKKGHDANQFTYDMARIPMYMWFSKEYVQKYTHKFEVLSNRKNHFFTNDLMYDTLLGILDISVPYYNEQYDYSSSQYILNLQNLLTMHGRKYIKDDPALRLLK